MPLPQPRLAVSKMHIVKVTTPDGKTITTRFNLTAFKWQKDYNLLLLEPKKWADPDGENDF